MDSYLKIRIYTLSVRSSGREEILLVHVIRENYPIEDKLNININKKKYTAKVDVHVENTIKNLTFFF